MKGPSLSEGILGSNSFEFDDPWGRFQTKTFYDSIIQARTCEVKLKIPKVDIKDAENNYKEVTGEKMNWER